MPGRVHIQRAQRDELADQPAPVRRRVIGADAEGRQPVVAVPQHAVGRLAAQHRDDVQRAEQLIGAIHRRQHLLRLHRRIHHQRRRGAVVAMAARLRQRPRRSTPATTACGRSRASVSAIISSSLVRITRFCDLGRGRLRQPVARLRDVLPAVQQQRVRRIAVAPGAADLLVIRLRAVRHVEMHDEAHVRPVDPHAEGDRRNHHHRLAGTEPRQRRALRLRHPDRRERRSRGCPSAPAAAPPARSSRGCRNRRCRRRRNAAPADREAARSRPPSPPRRYAGSAGGSWRRRFPPSPSSAPRRMSSRVRGSAVAVSATRGTPGK